MKNKYFCIWDLTQDKSYIEIYESYEEAKKQTENTYPPNVIIKGKRIWRKET